MSAESEDNERHAHAFRLKEEARAKADRDLLATIDGITPHLLAPVRALMKERDDAIGWVNHWAEQATDQMARGDKAERERDDLRAAVDELATAVRATPPNRERFFDALTVVVNL